MQNFPARFMQWQTCAFMQTEYLDPLDKTHVFNGVSGNKIDTVTCGELHRNSTEQ